MRTQLMRYLVSAVAVGAVAAGAAFAAPSASTVTIKTSAGLGAKLIVSSAGMTLYHYTDENTKGKIDCKGACATLWPPLLAGTAKPVAGPGLSAAKIGTVKRPDGKVQVTYNGLALYRYAADKKAGDVKGQGVEGSWFAVTSAGKITRAKATTADAQPTSAASGTSSSGTTSGSTSSGGAAGSTPAAPTNCTPGAIVTDMNSPCYNY